jgi:outer membrane scaffolding protein for murein synthesis (MipA/OmpV family)
VADLTAAGRIRRTLAAFALILPAVAYAELADDSLLGPGFRLRPAYDGSASRQRELVPVVRYFGRPWFMRSTQGVLEGGARIELAPGLHGGGQLAYEPGREPRESRFLRDRGVSAIDHGASLGVHLEWDHQLGPVPIALLVRTRQHADSERGAQADLRLSAGAYRGSRFAAGVFAQATWANAKATGSFYGITPQQSAATGLPAFTSGSGWLFGSLGLLWSVDLSQNWLVVGSMESRRLRGDASHSPLVERESNYYASAGLTCRF